ncbi:hypothetical protein CVT26_009386 [Gymnopilus dilepis]|uniref:Probable RNA polymerase II nuclear localization protein SLC7A6OS n=1 Tax=Gymnopilus dilepis TaxID=231916 RepID=A0A409VK42_9AGAR|nr:hypothetical protein CVT26_009386 [Gymnopilus dilepis]
MAARCLHFSSLLPNFSSSTPSSVPLDMQVDPVDTSAQVPLPTEDADKKPYTILRIKRKRNEEPLDALGNIPRKKSKNAVGVFQYAQTVENDAWDDAQRQRDIQEQISRLAEQDVVNPDPQSVAPLPKEAVPSPLPQEPARRYTIIENEELPILPRRYPTAPPKVLSAKALERSRQQSDFKMYDAVPANEQSMAVDQVPSEMDKFLPLLQDYLKIHEGADAASKAATPPSTNDDDYVWDVFYHRPVPVNNWKEAVNVGTVHPEQPQSTGLPPSFGDEYDSASDSDEELDEADEDSNAEEYYKNDYPEEEESDEFHDNSDQEDVVHYREDADDQCDEFP